jgi:hypothetical protein
MRYLLITILLVLTACRDSDAPPSLQDQVSALQKIALADQTAWRLLTALTTDVGARMAGSEGDAKAVTWARKNMNELGFDRVWLEYVEFPRWVRNSESAHIVGDEQLPLDIIALGGSPGTGGAVQGKVVHFDSLAALEAASDAEVAGNIVFISGRMRTSRDGAGYGETVPQRSRGPFVAAGKGAIALLIRSVGTDEDAPHTGMISSSEPGDPVPAAALSNPSADRLVSLLQERESVAVQLDLDCGFDGRAVSQNVIGEFDGSGNSGEFVVVGGHLDSWDPGTGAHDDGAGVVITISAAKLVADQPQRPDKGIRVVLFANEEQGVYGGKAYASAHAKELDKHLIGAESDLGAGRIYQFKARVNESALPAIKQLEELLEPLGIPFFPGQPAHGGADVGQMCELGMPVLDLNHDATRYFDFHHTRNDVLQNVSPENLQFNVAAYVSFIQWAASAGVPFGPITACE